jgi:hypothetical protein
VRGVLGVGFLFLCSLFTDYVTWGTCANVICFLDQASYGMSEETVKLVEDSLGIQARL